MYKNIIILADFFYKTAKDLNKKTAIIIKGNPKFIKNNKLADKFYDDLKLLLESLEYKVKFNAGNPYTQPPKADLWVGHSRGADRLRFAPKGTKTIAVSYPDKGSINHPEDNTTDPERFTIENKDRFKDFKPNKYHYMLSESMIKKIKKLLT